MNKKIRIEESEIHLAETLLFLEEAERNYNKYKDLYNVAIKNLQKAKDSFEIGDEVRFSNKGYTYKFKGIVVDNYVKFRDDIWYAIQEDNGKLHDCVAQKWIIKEEDYLTKFKSEEDNVFDKLLNWISK